MHTRAAAIAIALAMVIPTASPKSEESCSDTVCDVLRTMKIPQSACCRQKEIARGAAAQADITLRCDSASSSSDVIMVYIDTSRNIVHRGDDDNPGWYVDGRTSLDDNSSPSDTYSIQCTFKMTEFVKITDNDISFGTKEVSTSRCGLRDFPQYDEWASSNTIDRRTGIANFDLGIRHHPILSTFRCQRYTGKAF
jgi:hypothetical protein